MKFKKALALALAGMMSLSSLTAFAATNVEEKGKNLYDLGLFQGYSKDSMKLGLEDSLTREQAIKLTLTFLGYTEEDLKKDAKAPFTDIKDGSRWSEPWVKLALDLGITSGISETEFGYGEAVTKHQLTTFMLRALGYDKAWENAASLGFELDLLETGDLTSFEEASIRGDFAKIGYNTLMADVVGKETTLIEKLVDEKVADEDVAEKLGLVKEEVVNFEVASIESENLAETKVTFSKDLDEDTVKEANFKVNKKTVKDILKVDEKTLILFHDKVENGSEAEVEIKDVKDVDGAKVAKVKEDVRYLDTVLPELTEAQVIGSKTIRLSFSEAMMTKADGTFDKAAFKITKENGAKVYIKDAKPAGDNNRQVDITLLSSLEEQEYTIKVGTEITDYAGFGMVDTIVVDVEKDTEAPVVKEFKSATETTVTLVFDEDIVDNNATTSDFYHTNSKNKVTSFDVDGKELKLTFADADKLPQGTAYIFVKEDALKDLWGNKIEDIKFQITVTEDNEAPVIESIEQGDGNNKVVLKFKEDDFENSTITKKSNYTIMNDKDKEVGISSITIDGKKVTLTLREDVAGDAVIAVSGLKDKAGNKMDDTDFELNFVDAVAPKFPADATLYTTTDDYILRVKFDEAGRMSEEGTYSVLDQEKYQIKYDTNKVKELSDIDGAEVRVLEDGKSVELVLPKDNFSVTTIDGINVARVADIEGNVTSELVKELTVTAAAAVLVDKVEAVGTNKIEVTFKDRLGDVDFADFKIKAGATEKSIGSSEVDVNKDGNTVLTFIMEDEFGYDADALRFFVESQNSVTEYGVKVALLADKVIADKVAPVLDKDATATTTSDVIVLTFKEGLDATTATLGATDLKVELGSKKLVAGIDYTIVVNEAAKTVEINFAGDYAISNDDAEGTYTISVEGANYLADDAGNKVADFDIDVERTK